jgi:cytochrome P450
MSIWEIFRAILHDPETYPDPEEFKPERFLNEDGTVRDDPTLSLVFGIGKRICAGRHFVDATIFIVISSVLTVFDVTKAKDENGHEIPIKAGVTAGRGIVMWVLAKSSFVIIATSWSWESRIFL